MIDQAAAAIWARAYCFGQCRLESFEPKRPMYNHDSADFYFFTVVGTPYRVGTNHVIAVRKNDGRISCCGLITESLPSRFLRG